MFPLFSESCEAVCREGCSTQIFPVFGQQSTFPRQDNRWVPAVDPLRRCRVALKDGTLKGILWHQGESDSNPETASVYEQKLHALIARFRRELSAPDVPFLAGQMGQFRERPWSDAKKRVDAAHRSLPKQRMESFLKV